MLSAPFATPDPDVTPLRPVFNLRGLISNVLDATEGDVTVDSVVTEVADRIPDRHRDDALRQALQPMIEAVIRRTRAQTTIAADSAEAAEQSAGSRPAWARPNPTAAQPNEKLTLPRQGRAWKREGIAEFWRRALDERYAVDGTGLQRRLGDMTRDDLTYAINIREEHARKSAAKALQFRGLLDLMTRHDAKHVSDLPEPVLASILLPRS